MSNYDFKEATNLQLPDWVYDTLIFDCHYFNYIKNNTANISGFLNHLIPRLSKYREDLHGIFLDANDYNEDMVKIIEENIYNIYLSVINLDMDTSMIVPFRVNKSSRKDFYYIHDVLLNKYNMNFTNYVRTLLKEYAMKPLHQRELFNIYGNIKSINLAMQNQNILKIYLHSGVVVEFVPIVVDKSGQVNFICGCTESLDKVVVIRLNMIKEFSLLDRVVDVNEEVYGKINEIFTEFSINEDSVKDYKIINI
ncbi:MAG: hypothetical protein ACI4TX_04695 [Christensenellales bacterium]